MIRSETEIDGARIARRLDQMGAQLSALRATEGTAIPSLTVGTPATELRDALAGIHAELRGIFVSLRGDEPALTRFVLIITQYLEWIDALMTERYPPAPALAGQIDAVAARLTAPIIPKPGADGR